MDNDQEFFWSIPDSPSSRMSKLGDNSAHRGPLRPLRVLSADSLLQTPSLQPIIASRGARSKPNTEQSLRSARNLYDFDRNSVIETYAQHPKTHVHRLDDNFDKSDRVIPAVVYLHTRPRRAETPEVQRDTILDYDFFWLRPSPCYVLLKVLEMMLCLSIIIVSRVGEDDLELDLVHTLFGVMGLAVAAISLMILWIKGHPTPGDCLHTSILLCYGLTVPILLCGAILVLVQSDISNAYVPALAALFFVSMAVFTLDVIVLAAAVLRCGCTEPFRSFNPQSHSTSVYPHYRRGAGRARRHHLHHDVPLYDDDPDYDSNGSPRHGRQPRFFRHEERPRSQPESPRYPVAVVRDQYPYETDNAQSPSKPRMYMPETARTWTSETVPGQRRY